MTYTLGVSGESRMQFLSFNASYVAMLRSGDGQVEEHFVSYFSELIRLKLRSRLHSSEAIEDVRQETFARVIALLRSDGGVKEPERLGAFVNSICNNVLCEHYRAKSGRESSLENAPETALVHRGPSALSILETKDTARMVRRILKQLTQRDRNLLKAVLLEERDKDAVCTEFGVTRTYLRVLIHRAKQSFKSLYVQRVGDQGAFVMNGASRRV